MKVRLPTMEYEDVVDGAAVPPDYSSEDGPRRYAFWLAAATVVAAVGAIGVFAARQQDPRSATVNPVVSPTAATFYDEIEAVRSAVNGTAEQVGALRQTKIHGCMTAAGYVYKIPSTDLTTQITYYRPGWEFRPDRDLAQQAGMGLSDQSTNGAIIKFVVEDPGSVAPAGQISYTEQLAHCGIIIDRTYERVIDETSTNTIGGVAYTKAAAGLMTNPLAAEIDGELGALLTPTLSSDAFAPIQRTYYDCMNGYGFPVQTRSLDRFAEELVWGQMVSTDGINRVDPSAPEFPGVQATAKATDIKLSTADADCRAAHADQAAALLQPVLDQWLSANQARVDNAARFWLTTRPSASAESVNTFFDRIEAVYAALEGTPAQQAMLPHIQLRDCMAKAGATYALPAPADVVQGRGNSGYWHRRPDVQAAGTYGFGYGTGIATAAFYTSPQPAGLSSSEAAEYQDAFANCGATVGYGPNSSGDHEVPRVEAAGHVLSGELTGLMLEGELFTADFGPINTRWAQCLRDRGYNVTATTGIWDFAEDLVSVRGGQDPVARHLADVQFGTADAECRLPETTAVATILAPIFDEWISKNQAAVDAASLFWAGR